MGCLETRVFVDNPWGCCVLFSPSAGNTSHLGLLLCHSHPKDFNNLEFLSLGYTNKITNPFLLILNVPLILKTGVHLQFRKNSVWPI